MSDGVLDMLTVVNPDKFKKQGIKWVEKTMKERCAAEEIGYSFQRWSQFWSYFKKTWLGTFSPSIWNVCGIQHRQPNQQPS